MARGSFPATRAGAFGRLHAPLYFSPYSGWAGCGRRERLPRERHPQHAVHRRSHTMLKRLLTAVFVLGVAFGATSSASAQLLANSDPAITSPPSFPIDEGTPLSPIVAQATDPDAGNTLT